MRIAMLGHKRIPSHEGGIEVVVEELAARMVENGASGHLFQPYRPARQRKRI